MQQAITTDRSANKKLLDRLRQLVLSGEYPPGQPLTEGWLSQEFNVSRTPVREALKQLQTEGLVEIRPKVGTFVREYSEREIVEMFQVKESLEGLAAGLMARRGDIPDLGFLEANLEASDRAVRGEDAEEYARLVHDFHQIIVTGSDNRKLGEHYRMLMNQMAYHRLVVRSIAHPGRIKQSNEEHRKVLAMIKEKNPVGAEWAMRDHVGTSAREAMLGADPRR